MTDSEKLRNLADWFDIEDERLENIGADEVQKDLRRIADNIIEQQPIPQDIEKWIEDEAISHTQKAFNSRHRYFNDSNAGNMQLGYTAGATAMYQLLLPELQRLREEAGELEEGEHPDEIKPRAKTWLQERKNWQSEIEQQKSEIEELKRKIGDYKTEFAFDTIQRQDAEIQSLKAENERLKKGVLRLKELKSAHIMPYNLGDMGEIATIIDKLGNP